MSRNIVRVNKNNNYTVMSNYHLRDDKLSWKAKGIHSYVLSLPDDWKIILTHLKTMAIDGESSMRSGLKELYDLYYWQKYPIYVDGTIDKWVTEIYEEPFDPKEKIKNIIIRNNVETINYEHQPVATTLLGGNIEVGMLEEGSFDIDKDKLLSTYNTKDLFVSNNSFNQSNEKENERVNENINSNNLVNEFKQILIDSNIEDLGQDAAPLEKALRMLYYTDKSLKIDGTNIPPKQVREDLKRLKWEHLDLAMRDYRIASDRQEIVYVTAYLSRCIYNSIFNSSLKLESEINYNS